MTNDAKPDAAQGGEVRDIISSLVLMAEDASNWMDEHECADCKDGHLCSNWYSAVAASVVAPKAVALIKRLCDNQRSIPRAPSQRNAESVSGSLLAGSTHSKDALDAADYYHRNPSMALLAWDRQQRAASAGKPVAWRQIVAGNWELFRTAEDAGIHPEHGAPEPLYTHPALASKKAKDQSTQAMQEESNGRS